MCPEPKPAKHSPREPPAHLPYRGEHRQGHVESSISGYMPQKRLGIRRFAGATEGQDPDECP